MPNICRYLLSHMLFDINNRKHTYFSMYKRWINDYTNTSQDPTRTVYWCQASKLKAILNKLHLCMRGFIITSQSVAQCIMGPRRSFKGLQKVIYGSSCAEFNNFLNFDLMSHFIQIALELLECMICAWQTWSCFGRRGGNGTMHSTKRWSSVM